jgi:hypothetical protein
LHREKYISFGHKHFAGVIRIAEREGLPLGPFLRELRGNFCAQNSFWRPAVNPTGRLHWEKYISLGHKHFSGVIRIAEKEGLPFRRF